MAYNQLIDGSCTTFVMVTSVVKIITTRLFLQSQNIYDEKQSSDGGGNKTNKLSWSNRISTIRAKILVRCFVIDKKYVSAQKFVLIWKKTED